MNPLVALLRELLLVVIHSQHRFNKASLLEPQLDLPHYSTSCLIRLTLYSSPHILEVQSQAKEPSKYRH